MGSLFAPLVSFDLIEMHVANDFLVRFEHKMGPLNRPAGTQFAHGLHHNGNLVAIAATAALVNPTCAGLGRHEAIELARLCATRRDLCRPTLRLWREFVFPEMRRTWAVSYQDERIHGGDTYRFDGWVRLGRSRSGRSKTIWGWSSDGRLRCARNALQGDGL
jgi:hypothetical protein